MSPVRADPVFKGRNLPALDERLSEDLEVDKFVLDIRRNRKLEDIDIAERIIDGEIEQTMEGASNVTVTIHDPLGVLLNSGAFDESIDVRLGGLVWRLVAVNKNGSSIDLVFEDRDVAVIRSHHSVVRSSRKVMTRLEFCAYLIKKVKARRFYFVCPELHIDQPVGANTKKEKRDAKKDVRDRKRDAGLVNTGDFNVWYANPNFNPGVAAEDSFLSSDKIGTTRRANNKQVDIAEQILDAGIKIKGMTDKVLITGVAVGMVETGLTNPSGGDRDSQGVFQQRPSQGWTGLTDVGKAAEEFYKRALGVAKQYPKSSIGDIGSRTQMGNAIIPVYRAKVQSAAKYAKEFVEAYGSADLKTITHRKRVMFSTANGGKHEDWWTAIGRLLDETQFARFMSNGVLYMISEDRLMKSRVRMRLSEQTEGVNDISFNYDIGQKIANATVVCRASRWIAPPGTVVQLVKCGPASGKWLVSTVRRGFYSRDMTIELKKPDHKLKEPPGELVTKENVDEDVSTVHRAPGGGKSGKWYVAPGANRPGVGLKQPLRLFLDALAYQTSEQVRVNFGTNHGEFTTSGNVSDHWTGYGADLDVGGDARSSPAVLKKGNNIAYHAALLCDGVTKRQAREYVSGNDKLNFSQSFTWYGYRVQIGWRTMVGGDHYNHVHIGVH